MRLQMFKASLFMVLTALALGAAGEAQSKIPQFKDYPVTKTYKGKTARLVLTREDQMFRTRLTEASRMKPNFAGHHILATWSCGTSCLMGAVIDARSGKVHWFPFTICCWGFDLGEDFTPIDFRLISRLIVFSGVRNEADGDNGTHYYKFENGRFVHLNSLIKNEQQQ